MRQNRAAPMLPAAQSSSRIVRIERKGSLCGICDAFIKHCTSIMEIWVIECGFCYLHRPNLNYQPTLNGEVGRTLLIRNVSLSHTEHAVEKISVPSIPGEHMEGCENSYGQLIHEEDQASMHHVGRPSAASRLAQKVASGSLFCFRSRHVHTSEVLK
jgi:hypothetical protein